MFEWKAHIFAHTKLYCELKKKKSVFIVQAIVQ